jgi:hypothetical protein
MMVRAPVGPVQIAPAGLLGLLQLKIGGYMPDALKQDVQPNIDLGPYWLRSTRQKMLAAYSKGTTAGTYNAVIPLLEVAGVPLGPGNKAWWFVHDMCVLTSGLVAATTQVGLGFTETGGPLGNVNTTILTAPRDIAIGDAIGMSHQGFWVPPGAQLGCYIGTVAATGTLNAVLMGLAYSECPI